MKLIGILTVVAIMAWINMAVAHSWELADMNYQVNQTNFNVNNGCAGTLVSLEKRYILTAEHCLRNLTTFVEEDRLQEDGTVKKVKVYYRKPLEVSQSTLDEDGNITGTVVYRAEIVGTDAKVDLALVQVVGDLPNKVAAEILPAHRSLTRGETAWIVGNPAGLEGTVTRGIVSHLRREVPGRSGPNNAIKYTQIDGGVWFGNSGGGVFNDQGQLISVAVLVFTNAPHIAFGVDLDEIRSFLDNPKRALYSDDDDNPHEF